MQKYPKAEVYSAPAALKRKSALQAQTEYSQQGDEAAFNVLQQDNVCLSVQSFSAVRSQILNRIIWIHLVVF